MPRTRKELPPPRTPSDDLLQTRSGKEYNHAPTPILQRAAPSVPVEIMTEDTSTSMEQIKAYERRLHNFEKAVSKYDDEYGNFSTNRHYEILVSRENALLNESYSLDLSEDMISRMERAGDLLAKTEQKRIKMESTNVDKPYVEPPSLKELPKFSGYASEFQKFWTVFKIKVWDKHIEKAVKLDTLVNVVQDKNTKRLLESFDYENYDPEEVEKLLKETFYQPTLLFTKLLEEVERCPRIDGKPLRIQDLEEFRITVANVRAHKAELTEANLAQIITTIIKKNKISKEQVKEILPVGKRDAFSITIEQLYNWINEEVILTRQTSSTRATSTNAKPEPKARTYPTKFKMHAGNVTRDTLQCVFDGGNHRFQECPLSLAERMEAIETNNLCEKCLKKNEQGHKCLFRFKQCNPCRFNRIYHHFALCPNKVGQATQLASTSTAETNVLASEDFAPVPLANRQARDFRQTRVKTTYQSYYIRYEDDQEEESSGLPSPAFVPTGQITLEWQGRTMLANVFYDRGTTHTMISPAVVEKLQLPTRKIRPASVETINGTTPPYLRSCARLTVRGDSSFSDEWEVLVSVKMPVVDVPDVSHLNPNLPSDLRMCQSGTMIPDIVIGSWHAIDIAITPATPVIKITPDIMVEKNHLGWNLLGRGPPENHPRAYAYFTSTKEDPCQCKLLMKIFDDHLAGSKDGDRVQDEYVTEFMKNIRYDSKEKRFYAGFTWMSDARPENNYQAALGTSWRIFKNFNPPEMMNRYQAELDELVNSGYAQCIAGNATSGYFIPHFPVVKEGSTTSVRPVFNASFARKGMSSLNDHLFQGAWKQTNLDDCVLIWRTHLYALCTDVRKAFLQIRLEPKDQKYAKFLWFKATSGRSPRPVLYQMLSVLFGATASPFLLYAVLQKLFQEHAPESIKNFTEQLYMDDAILTANSKDDLRQKLQDVQEVLALGSFTLHKFASTPEVLDAVVPPALHVPIQETKVLGMLWLTETDEIKWRAVISSEFLKQLPRRQLTRREVASAFAKVFDPLGLLSPFMIKCRAVMRDAFSTESWDTPIQEEILPSVIQLFRELHHLDDITFPRACIDNPDGILIDIYTDGSSMAYSAVACASKNANQPSLLLCARSRLAPKESRSVAQLELCGAVLGVELGKKLQRLFKCQVRYYARSQTTINRIQAGPQRYETFEAHRIKLILKSTTIQDWHFIAKSENPACLAANGRSLNDLKTNDIWRNPIAPDISGPRVHAIRVLQGDPTLKQKAIDCLLRAPYRRLKILVEKLLELFDRRYHYLDRLSSNSIGAQSFNIIWKVAQRELLQPTIERVTTGSTKKIEPRFLQNKDLFIDENGLLRLDSRLEEADIPYDQRYKVVLPPGDLTSSFLKYLHNTVLRHASTPASLARLNQIYMIPDAEQRLRPIVDKCVRCRRYHARPFDTKVVPLPRDRVVGTGAFSVVGIDIFGQLRPTPRRSRRKAKRGRDESGETDAKEDAFYVLIFVCAQSRAIHLEPIITKSTASVKNAITRFCSLYGTPRKFWSDNEKSFAQMSKWLRSIRPHVEQAISEFRRVKPVEWQFNPPRSPWFGGFYERLIQLVKITLRSYQQSRFGSIDELYTILAEVQCMVNSRPLTRIPGEEDYLTPYHLLFGHGVQPLAHSIQAADPTYLTLIQGQKMLETKMNSLWRKWREVYLPSLRVSRSTDSRVPRVGELVMLNEPTRYRATWPIAVIQELHPDRHGVPHRATIKRCDGTVVRNITLKRLYPLEANQEQLDSSPH